MFCLQDVTNLKIHSYEVHATKLPTCCHLCNKSLPGQTALKVHMKLSHAEAPGDEKLRKFFCKLSKDQYCEIICPVSPYLSLQHYARPIPHSEFLFVMIVRQQLRITSERANTKYIIFDIISLVFSSGLLLATISLH